jgi:uncharacterized 2Fe-2S/4Fe-4S cluster protein (DUF4445 family)
MVAVDLGTTTLAASLVDRATGRRLAIRSCANPQRPHGADLVARLAYAQEPAASKHLTVLLQEGVRELVAGLLEETGISWPRIGAAALAGNPAMEHLLLGLPVSSLARLPYRPLFREAKTVPAADIGWPCAVPAYLFPLPSGFVGGDLVAFLFGQKEGESGGANCCRLFLDLGTNGELALAAPGGLFATSTAAGPAFEGGNIACGMVAGPGAVISCRVEGERLRCTTVDGSPPRGICGSGLFSAIAALLEAGVIDHTGRILPAAEIHSNLALAVTEIGGETAVVLHRDAAATVFLAQKDIREFQYASAALRAGILTLHRRAATDPGDVEEVVLTGSFGAELRPQDLKSVGIFTGKMVHLTRFVREGTLAGVERCLTVTGGRERVAELAASLQVVPLSGNPAFAASYLDCMNFPQ